MTNLICDKCGKDVEVINQLSSESPFRRVCDNCLTRHDQLFVLFSMNKHEAEEVEAGAEEFRSHLPVRH